MFKFKIIYIFLSIITFGLFPYISKKRLNKNSNELSMAKKMTINIEDLLLFLGTKENIIKVESTHSKVKFFIKDNSKINVEKIKSQKGISGIFFSSTKIDIIVGNQAKLIESHIKNFY